MQFDELKRREFITLLGGAAAAWPVAAARAQQGERMRRIGVLEPLAVDDPEALARVTAFAQGLQQLGWTANRNVRIDYRWGAGDVDRIRQQAAELAALAPDAILTVGASTTAPMLRATRTVPVVFVAVVDPVGAGYVDSLARPGGNATGFTNFEFSMGAKWLELLKEIAPSVTRVAVIRDPDLSIGAGQFSAVQTAAPSFGIEARPVNVRDPGEIERVIAAFARSGNGGLIVTRERVGGGSSPCPDQLGRPAQPARGLLRTLLCHRRRLNLPWHQRRRAAPARRRLYRSYPQRREARRPAGAGAERVRVGAQSEDREGARSRDADDGARARRRGDRIRGGLAAIARSRLQPPLRHHDVLALGHGIPPTLLAPLTGDAPLIVPDA